MITFSKREDFGMILMIELGSSFNKKQIVPLSLVSKKHNVPLFFLRNIASDLRRAGFIRAIEGKNGGYILAKDPSRIQFGKVIEALAKKPLFSCCRNTKNGRCSVDLCPHGFSPRRLANEFFESIYKKSFAEVVLHAYHKKS